MRLILTYIEEKYGNLPNSNIKVFFMENGANGQSCLTEREFDIGVATACISYVWDL